MIGKKTKIYNSIYKGERLNHVAFPMGGIGAGMVCLEGTGGFSHVSLRNKPDILSESNMFSTLCLKGKQNMALVLEGQVPTWKIFGPSGSGNGRIGGTHVDRTHYGLPRFASAEFKARFPFGIVKLRDDTVPLDIEITGWSPFIPGDADNSSLPVAGLEYRFANHTGKTIEGVYSFHAFNFMQIKPAPSKPRGDYVNRSINNGFILGQKSNEDHPWDKGAFCVETDNSNSAVDCAWFRDAEPLTMVWKSIKNCECREKSPFVKGSPSPEASIYVPLKIKAGKIAKVVLRLCWYVPDSDLRVGTDPDVGCSGSYNCGKKAKKKTTYKPWYTTKFGDINAVADFWKTNYDDLRKKTGTFTNCFYDTNLPGEVIEAVAANLTILKSPTVLRQTDGRLWGWEGCCDTAGSCEGSCTHVWNYAQAVPHLFPQLERSLRQTEFHENQNEKGHQKVRANLPIRPTDHNLYAAADGQLGGIIKVYRDWRISGDTSWLRDLWPKVKASLNYCIKTWDPHHKGTVEEPHNNTYDIEFWGPDSMCTSLYLGALRAAIEMGKSLADDISLYEKLLQKGMKFFNEKLFNGEYFEQIIEWRNLKAAPPSKDYSPEALKLLEKEGPKHQYGRGCLSDGVLGAWLAEISGLGKTFYRRKIEKHLLSVYRYNLKKDLSCHANLYRPGLALGKEGGLLLCTWPKGGELSFPFVYSTEVWTGIEYQVASHLMLTGHVKEGLEIVRTCRDRYDGTVRNPFDEYECGHWYARAMSSYALLQGLTGVRYDAVTRTLYISPKIKGNFRAFLATAAGYGTVGIRNGKVFVEVKSGTIEIQKIEMQKKIL